MPNKSELKPTSNKTDLILLLILFLSTALGKTDFGVEIKTPNFLVNDAAIKLLEWIFLNGLRDKLGRESFSTLSSSIRQNCSTSLSCHTSTETMSSFSLKVAWLESSFHD